MNRFQRMVAWDSGGNGGPSSAGGFIFNSLLPTQQGSTSPLQQQQPSLFGQSQFFSSRAPPPGSIPHEPQEPENSSSQRCPICFLDGGKVIRGEIDCCDHYFCFSAL
ncbi:hypothetical protein ACFX2I_028573 [Malus domestica]